MWRLETFLHAGREEDRRVVEERRVEGRTGGEEVIRSY